MSTSALPSFPTSQSNAILHNKRVSLIKRPPLVRSSSPTLNDKESRSSYSTNSFQTRNSKPRKTVRFCDTGSLENVRLFYKTEMPIACRADPQFEKKNYVYRLKRPNWPRNALIRRRTALVRMEDVQIQKTAGSAAEEKDSIILLGSIQVANLAFAKEVIVRYTSDDWATYQDVSAFYQEPIAQSANTWDRFGFKIILKKKQLHQQTLWLAVKYTVNGREFWDNNNQQNYEVDVITDVQLIPSTNINKATEKYPQSLESSLSSSDEEDDDDDDNIFEDCIEDADEHDKEHDRFELPQKKLPPTSPSTPVSSSSKPASPTAITVLTPAVRKSWSPPLSPTTPVDINPLWIAATTAASGASVTASMGHSYYVSSSGEANNSDTTNARSLPQFNMHTSKTRSPPASDSSMLHNYYFYL